MSTKVHYLNSHLHKFREKNKITIDVENIGDLAFPINWCKIMDIIEIQKLPKHHRHHYHSLVLGYWHNFNVKQKIERFHKQIKYGIFWSNNPNMYKN